jgi:hypothetical protein
LATSSYQIDVVDPIGRNVTCTEECWEKHILHQRPFMKSWEGRVAMAIQLPTIIASDADYSNREVYYQINTKKNKYIKVVAEKTNDPKILHVITAHPADSIKEGEMTIWIDSKS